MSIQPMFPAAYNAATRAQRHTWLTVGGGAVLMPPVAGALLAYMDSQTATEDIFEISFQMSGVLLGVGILPALLFAFLREPLMRRLFASVSRLTAQWARAAILLAGTLLVFLSYAAGAAGLFSLYMWLEGPARRLSYWQYLATESDMITGILRIFFFFGAPWLLAALASAWYVNRDLLPGGNWKADPAV